MAGKGDFHLHHPKRLPPLLADPAHLYYNHHPERCLLVAENCLYKQI